MEPGLVRKCWQSDKPLSRGAKYLHGARLAQAAASWKTRQLAGTLSRLGLYAKTTRDGDAT